MNTYVIDVPTNTKTKKRGMAGIVTTRTLSTEKKKATFYNIGDLVDFKAGESLANPAEKVEEGWMFHEDGYYTVSKALGSSINPSDSKEGWAFNFENGIIVDVLSDDWSIVFHKDKFYACNNSDLRLKNDDALY